MVSLIQRPLAALARAKACLLAPDFRETVATVAKPADAEMSDIDTSTSLAARAAFSVEAVSNATEWTSERSGSESTMANGPAAPCTEAHPVSGFSSVIHRATHDPP